MPSDIKEMPYRCSVNHQNYVCGDLNVMEISDIFWKDCNYLCL